MKQMSNLEKGMNNLREELSKLEDLKNYIKSLIILELSDIKDLETIKRLPKSPNCFIISSRDLDMTNFSPLHYDLLLQRDIIIKRIDKSKSIENVINLFKKICEDKRIEDKNHGKFKPHDNIIKIVKNIYDRIG